MDLLLALALSVTLDATLSCSHTTIPDHDPIAETLAERYRPGRDFIDEIRAQDVSDAGKLVREAHAIVLSEAVNPLSPCFEEVLVIAHDESLQLRHLFGVRAITRAHLREYRRIHALIRAIWKWKTR